MVVNRFDQASRFAAKLDPEGFLRWLLGAGIITQWAQLAGAEANRRLRGDYGGLARVFADLAGCRAAWEQVLGSWNMIESQAVNEWLAEGEARGEARGEAKGALQARREDLRILLEERFG